MDNNIKYLNEREAAAITGFALATLRNHRHLGRGIPYVKAGKTVRYLFADIIRFMQSHRISTVDAD